MKSQKIAIIGLGYVGLPTALALAEKKISVIGFDINEKRVADLNKAKSYIKEVSDARLKKALGHFHSTTDFSKLSECETILIAVPTALTKNRAPDLGPVISAAESIAQHLTKGTLVILESTTFPGTTEEIVQPILEKSGLKAGRDFYLAFGPERIDPGNKEFAFNEVTKVVGGIDAASTKRAVDFYKKYVSSVHPVSSPRVAEMTKLLENIFRLVNISLVNELKMFTDKIAVDFSEVMEAAKTKPYGFMPFQPGPGIGGHCIPLDPYYLSWKAKEYGFTPRFIELASEINEHMPHHVVTKTNWVLNKHKKSLNGARILVLGTAYKKDIDDARESPAIPILWDLLRKGAEVSYHDPYIPSVRVSRDRYNSNVHSSDITLKSVKLTAAELKAADCVLILTDHTAFQPTFIAKNSKLVIDTRNLIKKRAPHIYF